MNYGMIAPGNHGNFGFAARRTTPREKALSLRGAHSPREGIGYGAVRLLLEEKLSAKLTDEVEIRH